MIVDRSRWKVDVKLNSRLNYSNKLVLVILTKPEPQFSFYVRNKLVTFVLNKNKGGKKKK